MKTISLLGIAVLILALGGCATAPPPKQASTPSRGGYYLDDGPEANPPANLEAVPDAVPRKEPLHPFANRTYVALGTTYTPQTTRQPYRAEGLASWYGRRFKGRKTSSGEPYDMYAMTAAHPTLPIPSYARVTSLATGKSVVVRINDRGRSTASASSICPIPPLTSSAIWGTGAPVYGWKASTPTPTTHRARRRGTGSICRSAPFRVRTMRGSCAIA